MRSRPLAGPIAVAGLLFGCGTPAPLPGSSAPPPPPPEVAAAPAPVATPTPPADPSGESPSAWAPLLESEREWIRAVKARQPSSWAAHEPDPHVVILHDRDVKPDRVRRLGVEVMQALRAMAMPRFPPAKPIDRVILLRVCKDEGQYGMYGGPPGTDGYWSPADGEGVCYDEPMQVAHGRRSIRRVAVSQYLHLAGAPDTHPWFRAGVAALLSEPARTPAPKRHSWLSLRAQAASRAGRFLPPAEFVALPDAHFRVDEGRDDLAQAWSFAWFLCRARSGPWTGALERYFAAHRDRLSQEPYPPEHFLMRRPWPSEDAIAAARAAGIEAAFGGMDEREWSRLETAWRRDPAR